jgi:hypothetical protein
LEIKEGWRKMEHEKCLNCEHIPCANLLSNSKSDELDGGETIRFD